MQGSHLCPCGWTFLPLNCLVQLPPPVCIDSYVWSSFIIYLFLGLGAQLSLLQQTIKKMSEKS